jgi:hypothetical protein
MAGNKNSGRKSTAEKRDLIEALNKGIDINDVVLKLKELINEKNITAIRVYFEMIYGKPNQMLDVTVPDYNNITIPTIHFVKSEQ